jgi:hypothetical protein
MIAAEIFVILVFAGACRLAQKIRAENNAEIAREGGDC